MIQSSPTTFLFSLSTRYSLRGPGTVTCSASVFGEDEQECICKQGEQKCFGGGCICKFLATQEGCNTTVAGQFCMQQTGSGRNLKQILSRQIMRNKHKCHFQQTLEVSKCFHNECLYPGHCALSDTVIDVYELQVNS